MVAFWKINILNSILLPVLLSNKHDTERDLKRKKKILYSNGYFIQTFEI